MTTPWGSQQPPEQPGWGAPPPGYPPPGAPAPPPPGRGNGLLIGVIVLLVILIAGVGTGIGLLVTHRSSPVASPVVAPATTLPPATTFPPATTLPPAPPLPGGGPGSASATAASPTPQASGTSGSPTPAASSSAAPAAYDPILEGRGVVATEQIFEGKSPPIPAAIEAALQRLDRLAAAGDVDGIVALIGQHPGLPAGRVPTAAQLRAVLRTPQDLVDLRKTLRVHPDGQDCVLGFPGLLTATSQKDAGEQAEFDGDLAYLHFSKAQITSAQDPTHSSLPPILQLLFADGGNCGDSVATPAGQVVQLSRTP